ncbi:hypothetical protein CWC12_14730 [Pseudoalteromonas ruthenica]|uniref:NAD-dependent epimerase/dehydratase family protein n=2 Tax=Pseudoalteromonas ruthenica TaxID=151081 RepID=UPI0005FA28A9|nr:hypothetical protein CWC12_14730 [Pseudoalteromonas ruthenica]TMO91024.1 hypothetical protein CWC13_17585 [Pseudoalteromonas ruthenica]TMO98515.1 hypothetical protein CWC07_10455 [Pseudoalteromonas ruthenica]TMP07476.1 hypothetical protein CWC09_09875 [Pseudoalteromonas ruthenica]TMP10100.1 hypothetical protein CWC08_08185 [Pseudoalteromonas ruthenica]
MSVSKKPHIIMTGCSGFVGNNLLMKLCESGYKISTLNRKKSLVSFQHKSVSHYYADDFAIALEDALKNSSCDVFIHLAGAAHKPELTESDYLKVNVELTKYLARKAAMLGCKRFIQLSSIGVNGSSSSTPFTASDIPAPKESYSRSKYLAEQEIQAICASSDMEYVIIRPPLIYGPFAPGNFQKLVRLVKKTPIIPMGGIDNQRSFVSIYNLISFIEVTIEHPNAANEVFLVSDEQDISTSDFVNKIISSYKQRTLLISLPWSILRPALKLIGKEKALEKITSNVTIEMNKSISLLDWKPPLTIEESLEKSAFHESNKI